MRPLRIALALLLVVLLATSAGAGNAAVAAERTVLSGEYVKAALADEGAYETLQSLATEQASAGIANATRSGSDGMGALPISRDRLLSGALPQSYVRTQVERGIDEIYGYLHGNRDSATVAVNLTPVGENAGASVESQLRNASLAELLETADEESLSMGGASVDPAIFEELSANQSAYRAARSDFRTQVRAAVVDRYVRRAYDSASSDALLSLVIENYDPDEHTEAEKEQMVADRETEIEAALRERARNEDSDQIDRGVEDALDALPGEVRSQFEDPEATGELSPEASSAFADLAVVGVEGLAGEMSYETYTDRLETEKADFAAAVGDEVESRLAAQLPGRQTILDTSDPSTRDGLARAQSAVTTVDLLSIALPVLALVFVGLLWLLTRSPAATAAGTGAGLLLGAIPGYAAASVVPSMLADQLGGGFPPELRSVVLGLTERTAATVATQSLALAVLGVVLIAGGLYLRTYGTPAFVAERLA